MSYLERVTKSLLLIFSKPYSPMSVGQNAAGFKLVPFVHKTWHLPGAGPAELHASGSQMGQSQYGAICTSPVSYLPLPASHVLDLCCCPHHGVLLSGKSPEQESHAEAFRSAELYEWKLIFNEGDNSTAKCVWYKNWFKLYSFNS